MVKHARLVGRGLQWVVILTGATGFNPLLGSLPDSGMTGLGRHAATTACVVAGVLLVALSVAWRTGRFGNWRGLWLVGALAAGVLGVRWSLQYMEDLRTSTYAYPEDPPRIRVRGTEYTEAAEEHLRTNPMVKVVDLVANYGGPENEELVWTRRSLQEVGSRLAAKYALATLALVVAMFCAVESSVRSPVLPVDGVESLKPLSPGTSGQAPGPRIFVSYSHRDSALVAEFKRMLAPAIQSGAVDLWDDTRIQAGADWREKIAEALTSARVAVLLVTDHFLASEFIARHELAPLLERSRACGTTIFWIHVSPAMYDQTGIERYQAAHDVSKPLSTLTKPKRLKAWHEICMRLVRTAQESQSRGT